MRSDLAFRIALFVLLVGFVVHRGYYTRRLGGAAPAVDAAQRSPSGALAGLLSIAALLATLVYGINPRWIAWGSLPFPAWLRWGGLLIALAGFGLLQWAQHTLGTNWSDTPRLLQHQTLVTGGPYRWIRHPIYTAFLLILSATLLLSANWVVGVLWLWSTGLAVRSRIGIEETLMLDQFGERYRTYMHSTGRLLPRLIR